jgi:uncharacterized RDD family membrane protein YckC
VPAPDKLTIDTPEQIALEFTLATLGSRFLAVAVDLIVQAAIGLGILAVISLLRLLTGPFNQVFGVNLDPQGFWLQAVVLLAWFVIYYGYYAFFEARWNGQTPGKRLIGLRTIHTSGRPITPYEAILRNLVRIVDQLPGIYAVGMLSVFLTSRSQRLGDLAADTVVVHEQPADAVRPTDAPAPAVARYGAAKLSPDEVALIEAFLRRRDELIGVRELRAGQIASRIRARLGVETGPPDETFLEQVAAEYRSTGRYQ